MKITTTTELEEADIKLVTDAEDWLKRYLSACMIDTMDPQCPDVARTFTNFGTDQYNVHIELSVVKRAND